MPKLLQGVGVGQIPCQGRSQMSPIVWHLVAEVCTNALVTWKMI